MPVVNNNPEPATTVSPTYVLIGTVVVIAIVLIIFLVIVYFVAKWVIGFLKSRSDLYYNVRKRMFDLAKMHSFSKIHWWHINKNIPIRLVHPQNGHPVVGETVAYYGGHFYSHGSTIMRVYSPHWKQFFVLPKQEILIVNEQKTREVLKIDKHDKDRLISETLNFPVGLLQFNRDEILLYAYGITSADSNGIFYYPEVVSDKGEPYDLSIPAFETVKNFALGDALLSQSKLFVEGTKLAVQYNPVVRIHEKINDSSQTVENNQSPINQGEY